VTMGRTARGDIGTTSTELPFKQNLEGERSSIGRRMLNTISYQHSLK